MWCLAKSPWYTVVCMYVCMYRHRIEKRVQIRWMCKKGKHDPVKYSWVVNNNITEPVLAQTPQALLLYGILWCVVSGETGRGWWRWASRRTIPTFWMQHMSKPDKFEHFATPCHIVVCGVCRNRQGLVEVGMRAKCNNILNAAHVKTGQIWTLAKTQSFKLFRGKYITFGANWHFVWIILTDILNCKILSEIFFSFVTFCCHIRYAINYNKDL